MKHILIAALAVAAFTPVQAAAVSFPALPFNQCEISGGTPLDCASPRTDATLCRPGQTSGCTDAVRSAPGPGGATGFAQFPIDVWNICRYVDNTSGINAFFVPFRSKLEWTAFNTDAPSNDFNLLHCSRPGSGTVPSNGPTSDPNRAVNDPYPCFDAQGNFSTAAQTISVPNYTRVDALQIVAPENTFFVCTVKGLCAGTQCGADQTWIKTAVSVTFRGLDADRAGGSTGNRSASDWKTVSVTYHGAPPAPLGPPILTAAVPPATLPEHGCH